MKKIVFALLAAAFCASVYAGSKAMRPTFSDLDTNGDGSISFEEAAASNELSEKFSDLDVNADDKLDGEEFAKFEAQ